MTPLCFAGVIIIVLVILILIATWIIWYHPHVFFTPVNGWLSRDSTNVQHQPYFDSETLSEIYPDYLYAEEHYLTIREEAHGLWEKLKAEPSLPLHNYLDNYHVDLTGADTSNWDTIPLRVFGKDQLSHQAQCPFTTSLLQRSPKIRSCIFSFMAPGKVIQPHHGPYHGLIRYQLPLTIPNTGSAFLTVDGIDHHWEEGKSVLFDETYLHSASNLTDQWRVVMLMDFPRPYQSSLRQLVSELITSGMGWMSTG